MPQRRVGYVELEWVCSTCKNRNPGPQKLCQGCGAAQPENVQFEAPVEQKLVTNAEQLAHAAKAADVHCLFCDARNPADARICSQCGAELSKATHRAAGEIVGAFDSKPKPAITCPGCGSDNPANTRTCLNCGAMLDKPRPVATMPRKQARGWAFGSVLLLVGLAMCIAFGFLIYQATRQKLVVGTIQSAQWVRTVELQALVPVDASAWEDQLPNDAEVQNCSLARRGQSSTPTQNSREVCGTPYTIDKGTGFGEVVQDCWYDVYDRMCDYTVQQWQTVDQATTRGYDFRPFWPELDLAMNQRIGKRSERFQCVIAGDSQTYTYEPTSYTEYTRCEPGRKWQMQVNGFGSINSILPLD